jgi:hypothetical protein
MITYYENVTLWKNGNKRGLADRNHKAYFPTAQISHSSAPT